MNSKDLLLRELDLAVDRHKFEMFTKAGGIRVKTLTKKVVKKIFSKQRVTQFDIENLVHRYLNIISDKFPECYDTEPRANIEYYVNVALNIVGYSFKIRL